MELDYSTILENINVNLVLVVIYIGILSAFVEGMVEFFKAPIRYLMGITPDKKIEKLEKERFKHLQRSERFTQDEGLKEFYIKLADDTLKDIQSEWQLKMEVRGQKHIRWLNVILPVFLGVGVVWLFWPFTLFTFLPFGPHNELIGIAVTAVLIGRGSNGAHGAWNKLGGIFESLIGRIGGRF
jgi:hypothetical protein